MNRQLRLSVAGMALLLALMGAMLFQTQAMAGEAGVSFYEPEEETVTEPQDPEPEEKEPGEASSDSGGTTYTKKATLPQTGETGSSSWLLGGASLLGIAAWMVMRGFRTSFT